MRLSGYSRWRSGSIQLMLLDKQNRSCNVNSYTQIKLLRAVELLQPLAKVSCDLSVNKFVLYLNESSSYSWILENSITKIYITFEIIAVYKGFRQARQFG